MKGSLIILILLMCFNAKAQDSPKLGPAAYGIFIGSSYNYRQLNKSDETTVLALKNETEIGAIGWRFGLNTDFDLNEKFCFQWNFIYANRSFKTRTVDLLYTTQNSSNPSKAFTTFNYNYFDMPFRLKYQFGNGAIGKNNLPVKWFVAGGISPSILLNYTRQLSVYNDGNWTKTKDSQTIGYDIFNLIAEVEIGFDYTLAERTKIRTALNYQQALKGTNAGLVTREYLYGIEFSLGVYFTPYLKEKKGKKK